MILGLSIGRHCCVVILGAEVPGATSVQVVKGARRRQLQLLSQLFRRPCAQLVEDVVVALVRTLADHSGSLEKVVRDVAARHL